MCVRVTVCVCVSRAITKEVLLQLTQALEYRGEHQDALYLLCIHTHKTTEEGQAQQGGRRHTHQVMYCAGGEVTGV